MTPAPASTAVTGDQPADAEPPERFNIEIEHLGGDWTACGSIEPLVARLVAALIATLEVESLSGSATLGLSDDAHVQELNAAFRGIDKATNVLSFPSPPHVRVASGSLGDVVIAGETLLREAAQDGITPQQHLFHLALHGVLHLLGYDHVVDADAAVMEGIESRVLMRAGWPDPWGHEAARAVELLQSEVVE